MENNGHVAKNFKAGKNITHSYIYTNLPSHYLVILTGFSNTPSSRNDSSASPSLFCSFECSRCESLASASAGDVANLKELYDDLAVDPFPPCEDSSSDINDSLIDERCHVYLASSNMEPHSSKCIREAALCRE